MGAWCGCGVSPTGLPWKVDDIERNRLSRFTGPNHDQTAHNNGTDTEARMIKQRKQRLFGVTGLGEAQRLPYK